jgi:putative hydrolase of the HAD superfamily
VIAPATTPAPALDSAPVVAGPLHGAALRGAATWVFDLDNTLYPASCNLFAQVSQRMGEFIARTFAVDLDEARRRQKGFFQTHGTTLRGLMVEHGIAPAEFLDYVHDIDLGVVSTMPALEAALQRLPGRKLIYTNGTVAHADRILRKLGIHQHFEATFDIVASDYLPKPEIAPYRVMLQRHGVDPARAVMVEDMARNLVPAAALGMTTVWVPTTEIWSQPDADGQAHIHHTAPDLTAFLTGLPD